MRPRYQHRIFMEVIAFVLIGIVAGWIAWSVIDRDIGILGDLVLGMVGATLGGLMMQMMSVSMGMVATFVVAFFVAFLVIVAGSAIRHAQ